MFLHSLMRKKELQLEGGPPSGNDKREINCQSTN